MMLATRFSLRALLGVLMVISVCLAGERAFQAWYVRHYPGYYVSTVLYTRLHNGDSFQDVLRRFDSVRPVEGGEEWATLQRIWQAHGWPIEEDDEFFHFSVAQHGAFVQFRHGRVVNLPTGAFDLDQLARTNNYAAPPAWLRFGTWPFWILLGACFVLAGWVRARRGLAVQSQ